MENQEERCQKGREGYEGKGKQGSKKVKVRKWNDKGEKRNGNV